MARNTNRRRPAGSQPDRIRSQERELENPPSAAIVVGSAVGSHPLRHRLIHRKFVCATADCGSGRVECGGAGPIPPASLAEFTLNGDQGLDFYDVSLVDGYNIPMLIIPKGGTSGGCVSTGCLIDLNGACPRELAVARGRGSRESVACRSACEAFGDPVYCCSEAYNTPDTCHPSVYSLFFKNACPRSYSYAYDDKTSTFTCAGADYIIIFCPLPYTSMKFLGTRKEAAELPLVNKTMMYVGRHRTRLSSPG